MGRTVHECPSCAAPLGVPDDHERFFTCDHCGTVIEDVAHGRDAVVELTIADTAPAAAVQPQGSRVIAITAALAVLGVGAAVAFLQVQSEPGGTGDQIGITDDGGVAGPTLTSVSAGVLVSSDDDTSPDLVVSARQAGDAAGGDALLTYLDEEAEGGVRWEVPSVDARSGAIVVADDLVVVSSGDRLLVHDRATGAQRSELRPPDTVQHSICADCVRVIGTTVVALSSDGTLAAVEPDEGVLLWERRLAAQPRQLLELGGMVGVVEDGIVDGEPGLLLLDPATGEQTATLPVSCLDPVTGRREPVGVFDQLHRVDGDGVVLLWQRGNEGCAARWDLGGSAPTWERPATFGFAADFAVDTTLRHGDLLLHAERGAASAIDTVAGEVRDLARSDEHDLHALFVKDGVLVLAAESSRGTGSWQLWGIDPDTGDRLWEHDLAADRSLVLDPARRADDAWFAVPTTDGITVGTLVHDDAGGAAPVTLTLQTLPPRSGTAGPSTTVELPPALIPSAFVIGARGSDLHLAYETGVWTIDVPTGTPTRRR